jgi:hypothetical protein
MNRRNKITIPFLLNVYSEIQTKVSSDNLEF